MCKKCVKAFEKITDEDIKNLNTLASEVYEKWKTEFSSSFLLFVCAGVINSLDDDHLNEMSKACIKTLLAHYMAEALMVKYLEGPTIH